MKTFHLITFAGALAGALVLSASAQAGCGGAYPTGIDAYGYPTGYVLIPNWDIDPCVRRGRSAGYRHDPFGVVNPGWYNKDSFAARGTEYEPEYPDPGVVTDAH